MAVLGVYMLFGGGFFLIMSIMAWIFERGEI